MSGGRARLFVALELPADVRETLAHWAMEQAGETTGLRWVDRDSLHVTLCFLGSRPHEEVDAIAAACAGVSELPAATLRLSESLWLPPRRPRVLTVTLQDEQGRLAAVQSALARALADGGFYAPETRPFLAHVTVARVGRDGRTRRGTLPAPTPLRFTGSMVTLYESRLGGGPARYEALARVALRG